MSSTGATETWEPFGNGFYRFYRDGAATPLTSLTDRGAGHKVQLEQLSRHGDWLPEQVLQQHFEAVQSPDFVAPYYLWDGQPDRVLPPPGHKSTILVSAERGETPDHPLRRYLWPVIDEEGNPVLDTDEQVLLELPGATIGSKSSDVRRFVTNRRILTTGRLDLPIGYSEDYNLSLGLLSPTAMEALAAFRQIRRVGQNHGKFWVEHMRYEWFDTTSCVRTTTNKKGLFSKKATTETSSVVRCPLRRNTGDPLTFQVLFRYRSDDAFALADTLVQAMRKSSRDLGLMWDEQPPVEKSFEGGRKLETTTTWEMQAGAAHSVPAGLCQ
jgi:hypothetical protein